MLKLPSGVVNRDLNVYALTDFSPSAQLFGIHQRMLTELRETGIITTPAIRGDFNGRGRGPALMIMPFSRSSAVTIVPLLIRKRPSMTQYIPATLASLD